MKGEYYMTAMSNDELKQIKGGGINWGITAGISAFVSFVIGVIDGWMNPKRC